MKKNYMTPDLKCREMDTESELLTSTVAGVNYDGTHAIETGGNAENGEESDSRSFSVWDDGEF